MFLNSATNFLLVYVVHKIILLQNKIRISVLTFLRRTCLQI